MRKILFYFLLFLFIIAAPILVAFSLGYTFNIQTAQVEKTGGIFMKSKISRLSIFLDGVFQKETSIFSGGALLTGLKPRTYLLRIERPKYQPWSKTVEVQESFVTELRNIILLPNPVPYATSTLEEITEIHAPSTTEDMFSLDKKNNLIDVRGVIIVPNIHAFSVKGDTIYIIDKNGFLGKLARNTGNIEILGRPGFYLNKKKFVFIYASGREDVVIIDPSGGLFFLENGETLSVITGGVMQVRFDKEEEKLLILKENEILIRWLEDNALQPFQKKGTEELVLKLESPVLDAAWYYDTNNHIVIRTASGIFITEIDGRGGRNTGELVSGKTDELFTTPLLSHDIFYRKEKQWFTIRL